MYAIFIQEFGEVGNNLGVYLNNLLQGDGPACHRLNHARFPFASGCYKFLVST